MSWQFTGGLPETPCGAGSTLKTTEYLRTRLPWALTDLQVMTLLDAPCGDCNWIAETDLTGIDYIGCDINHLKQARANARRAKAHTFRFIQADIIKSELPRSDAILCRDFMQHLPNEMVFQTLRNFHRTGADWLLLTSHSNQVNEDISKPGDFRPLNLMAAPFNLPEPKMTIADPPGSGRVIGVWKTSKW